MTSDQAAVLFWTAAVVLGIAVPLYLHFDGPRVHTKIADISGPSEPSLPPPRDQEELYRREDQLMDGPEHT